MRNRRHFYELGGKVLSEHQEALAAQRYEDVETLMKAIVKAKRVFMLGAGREGISLRGFAMRVMHLGKEVHWLWDDTTPGMQADDLFVAVNGSGNVGSINYVIKCAKKTGAAIAVVTAAPQSYGSEQADVLVEIPVAAFGSSQEGKICSIMPMGSLFEQYLYILFDLISFLLEEWLSLDHAAMEQNHRNVE